MNAIGIPRQHPDVYRKVISEIVPTRIGKVGGIEFTERRDHALTRPVARAMRFARRPIIVAHIINNLEVTA